MPRFCVRWRAYTRSLWPSMRLSPWTSPSPRLTRSAQRRRMRLRMVLLAHCHSCMRPYPRAMGWPDGSGLPFPALLPLPRASLRPRDARLPALLGYKLRGVYRARVAFEIHIRHVLRAQRVALAQLASSRGAGPTYGGNVRNNAAAAPRQRSNGGASARRAPRARRCMAVIARPRRSAGCRARAEQRQPLAVQRPTPRRALASSASAAARHACARPGRGAAWQ